MMCPGCRAEIDIAALELDDADAKALRARLAKRQWAGQSQEARSAAAKRAALGRWGRKGEADGR